MSEINKNIGNITSKIAEQGAPVIEQLLDKLTGKGALIKYSFEDLRIEMPSATDPNGRNLGGGKMTIRGTVTISAKVQKIGDTGSDGIASTGISMNNNENYDNTLRAAATNNSSGLVDSTQEDQFKTSDAEPALRDYKSSSDNISSA